MHDTIAIDQIRPMQMRVVELHERKTVQAYRGTGER